MAFALEGLAPATCRFSVVFVIFGRWFHEAKKTRAKGASFFCVGEISVFLTPPRAPFGPALGGHFDPSDRTKSAPRQIPKNPVRAMKSEKHV